MVTQYIHTRILIWLRFLYLYSWPLPHNSNVRLSLIYFLFNSVKRYPRGTTAQIVKSVAPNDAKTQRSSINSSRSGPKTSNSVSANAFSATAKTAVATSDTGSTTSTIASSASRGSRSSQLISNLADLTALNFLLASLDPNHSGIITFWPELLHCKLKFARCNAVLHSKV